MKRLVLILIAVCLAFGGCGVIKETDEPGEPVPVGTLVLQQDSDAFRVKKSAVYFYNEQSDTLTAEIRSLFIGQDENPAKAAIELLLEGPFENSELLGTAPEDIRLSFIEYSRDVANVYLRYTGPEMQPELKHTFELAIANTVTDLLEAKYVCIFYNGLYSGFSGQQGAPLEKQTGSISEAYNQASARYIGALEPEVLPEDETDEETENEAVSTAPPTQQPQDEEADTNTEDLQIIESQQSEILTVLYFVSEDGAFILPEVRSITYTDEEYIETLIRELKAGPDDTSSMKSFLPQSLELLSPPVIIEDSVQLSLSELPTAGDASSEEYFASYAALVYTITGFMPNIKSVDLSVLGQPITDFDSAAKLKDGMQRADYHGLIGSSVPVYLPDKESDLLLKLQRSMEQANTWSPRQRLLEIMRGPLKSDMASTWPAMLTGITMEDILSVKTYDDTVVVNLSQNFKDVCEGRSAKDEMQLIYSMVNTLTAMDGINKVQFLVEGQQTNTLSGTLCISDPFLMNYGIIKQ